MNCTCCGENIGFDATGISDGWKVLCWKCFITDYNEIGITEIDGDGYCACCGDTLEGYYGYKLGDGTVVCETCMDECCDDPEKFGFEKVEGEENGAFVDRKCIVW